MKRLKATIYYTGSPEERAELLIELEELAEQFGAKLYHSVQKYTKKETAVVKVVEYISPKSAIITFTTKKTGEKTS